jgi:hypothetical protein
MDLVNSLWYLAMFELGVLCAWSFIRSGGLG